MTSILLTRAAELAIGTCAGVPAGARDCQMDDTTVHVDDVCVMERGVYRL